MVFWYLDVCASMRRSAKWYSLCFSGEKLDGRMLPAPPWMMSRGLMVEEGSRYSMIFDIGDEEVKVVSINPSCYDLL